MGHDAGDPGLRRLDANDNGLVIPNRGNIHVVTSIDFDSGSDD